MGAEDLVAFAAALAKVRTDVAVRSEQVLQDALRVSRIMRGGGGEFERGGTSASGGMEMTQQQQQQLNMMMEELTMELAPPGADMMQ
jgi:Spy/CpxP family protein refolding chaperone